jgi:hypothetical protein
MGLFFLLFIPLFVALCFYIGSALVGNKQYSITWKEFLLQMAIVVVIVLIGYFVSRYESTQDTEVWNAVVVDKKSERVSCEHSYPCRCRPVSCGKNCTTTHCDTCYEHSYDVSWYVDTTAKERFEIDRVNRQGTEEPPRWAQVRMGAPTARLHTFTNYIKANPDSLLNRRGEVSQYTVPAYPLNLYDYHYVDRFIADVGVGSLKEWNRDVQVLNSSLGVEKQVNIVVVVTEHPESFSHELENTWLGGKKNDLIVLIGSKDHETIDWVRVLSWSHSEVLKVELRDDILELGSLTKREEIVSSIKTHVQSGFVRMEMEDYKYLLAGLEPSAIAMWILTSISLILSVGLSWLFYREDIFGEVRFSRTFTYFTK